MHIIIFLKKIVHFKLFYYIMQMTYEGLLEMDRQQKSLFLSMDIIITNHLCSKYKFRVQGISKNGQCMF